MRKQKKITKYYKPAKNSTIRSWQARKKEDIAMKIFISPASPYARKARIMVIEKALDCEMVTVTPWEDSAEMAINPLRKVPFLITDEGQEVFDSRVICEYLDSQSESPCFLPAIAAQRLVVKTRDAMVEGAMDAVLTILMSKFVDPDMGDTMIWRQWLMSKANRVLEELEKNIDSRDFQDISDINCYCLLDFWLFRLQQLNEYDWRSKHPKLQSWFARISERESCKKTNPRNT